MSDLKSAIADTVNNQNEVSDFLNTPPAPQGGAGEEAEAPAAKPLFNLFGSKPAEPPKRGRGRPAGTGKHQKQSAKPVQQSTVWTGGAASSSDLPPPAALMPEANPEADQRKKAAKGATMLVQNSGMMIAGGEGKMGRDEFSNVEENFDRYFEATGIKDFPPGIALGLALGGYYIRVLTAETARPRVSVAVAWLKSKMTIFRRKAEPSAPETEEKSKWFSR